MFRRFREFYERNCLSFSEGSENFMKEIASAYPHPLVCVCGCGVYVCVCVCFCFVLFLFLFGSCFCYFVAPFASHLQHNLDTFKYTWNRLPQMVTHATYDTSELHKAKKIKKIWPIWCNVALWPGPWQRNFVDACFLQFHMFPTVWSYTTTIGLLDLNIQVRLKVTFTVT